MITTYDVFVPPTMGYGASKRVGIDLAKAGHKKAFMVYDKGMWDFGIAQPIIANLEAAGIEVVTFDKVLPDPPDEMVEEAAEIARNSGCDCIVGLGGGSSMDTAKGVNVLMKNPPPIRQYFGVRYDLEPGVPLIFIPTTAGTGSETTNMCVISCVSQGNKASVVSAATIGTHCYLDPALTLGLPKGLTSATGLDALAHAVESLTGGQQNPLSDALGCEAIRMITKYLPIAVADGKNKEARENLMYASYFAGMTFTNALVHAGHALAHTMGAHFHTPHGIACAIMLPGVTEWTALNESKKVRMVCECMGVTIPEDADYKEVGRIAKETIRSFAKSVGNPSPKDLGISLEDFLSVVPLAMNDTGLALCPYRMTANDVKEIFIDAYDA